MTFGNEAPKVIPKKRSHEDCQHGGAYLETIGTEERRVYVRDYPLGEYDVEYVDTEYWACPQCGATWSYDVD